MTDVGPQTSSGARLYIGTTAAVAATDSFVEISEIGELPEIGREYDIVTWKPISDRAVRKFKGGYNDGDLAFSIGKDLTNTGQLALQAAQDSDFDYNFKIVDNDDVPAASATVTMSAGDDEVTDTAHGLSVDTAVQFTTTGALLSPLAVSTTYYIKAVPDADSYTLALTKGGAVINLAASPAASGVHTRVTVPAGSYTLFKAKVTKFKTERGDGNQIIKANVALAVKSGSVSEQIHLP